MPNKQSKTPTHGTHNKQQTRTNKQITKKTITDKQRQKIGIIVLKIVLDKVIKTMAVFSPVLQPLAKNR